MKKIAIPFMLFLLSTVLLSAQKPHIVEIRYTGPQEYPMTSIVISTHSLTDETKAKMLERIGIDDRFTPIDKSRIWDKNYLEIITDKRSLKKVIKFITANRKRLGSSGRSIYDIHINDKKYTLPSSNQQAFFKDMTDYLDKKDCDPKLILDLKNWM